MSAVKQEYEEKTISLSQKPNGDKGFGLTISGGKEYSSPVVIDKVTLGLYRRLLCLSSSLDSHRLGPFKCYVMLFSGNLTPIIPS